MAMTLINMVEPIAMTKILRYLLEPQILGMMVSTQTVLETPITTKMATVKIPTNMVVSIVMTPIH